jgi:hypothetical protein
MLLNGKWLCCQSCHHQNLQRVYLKIEQYWILYDMLYIYIYIWYDMMFYVMWYDFCTILQTCSTWLVNWGNLAMGSAAERLPKEWGQSVLVEPRTSTLWSKRSKCESAAMPKVVSICDKLWYFLFSMLIKVDYSVCFLILCVFWCFLHCRYCRSELNFQLTLAPHQILGWYQERKRQWGISSRRWRFHRISRGSHS